VPCPPAFPTAGCQGRLPLPPVRPIWPAGAQAPRIPDVRAPQSPSDRQRDVLPHPCAAAVACFAPAHGTGSTSRQTPNSSVPPCLQQRCAADLRAAPRSADPARRDISQPYRFLPERRHAARRTLLAKGKCVVRVAYPASAQDRAPRDSPASAGQLPRPLDVRSGLQVQAASIP
jgi:hypothetical protein